MIKNLKLQMNIMGVPAYSIINEIWHPEELTVEKTGEKFWRPYTMWHGFHNKKLHDATSYMDYDEWDKVRHKYTDKDAKHSWSVKEEYQLPFSETGYRSVIFDVGHEEKLTKENLKKWVIGETYEQLGIEEQEENPWAYAGIKCPVEIVKEVKFNAKNDSE